MARVTGIGGIFFKSKDPKALMKPYHRRLGIECRKTDVSARFDWREERARSSTVRPTRCGRHFGTTRATSTPWFETADDLPRYDEEAPN